MSFPIFSLLLVVFLNDMVPRDDSLQGVVQEEAILAAKAPAGFGKSFINFNSFVLSAAMEFKLLHRLVDEIHVRQAAKLDSIDHVLSSIACATDNGTHGCGMSSITHSIFLGSCTNLVQSVCADFSKIPHCTKGYTPTTTSFPHDPGISPKLQYDYGGLPSIWDGLKYSISTLSNFQTMWLHHNYSNTEALGILILWLCTAAVLLARRHRHPAEPPDRPPSRDMTRLSSDTVIQASGQNNTGSTSGTPPMGNHHL